MTIDHPPKEIVTDSPETEAPLPTLEEQFIESIHVLSTEATSEEEKRETFAQLDLQKLTETLATSGNDDLIDIVESYIADKNETRAGSPVYKALYKTAWDAVIKKMSTTDVVTMDDGAHLNLIKKLQAKSFDSPNPDLQIEKVLAPYLKNVSVADDALEQFMNASNPLGTVNLFIRAENTTVITKVSQMFSRWLTTGRSTHVIERFLHPNLRSPATKLAIASINKYTLDTFGIDFEKGLMPFWVDEHGDVRIKQNFKSMRAIEKEAPGGVQLLYEPKRFNIKEFGRYPEQLLIQQVKDVDKDIPYGVVFFPRADHNDAFDSDTGNLSQLFEDTEGRHGIRVFECDTKRDMARAFLSLDKAYGDKKKIAFAVWGGHGTPDSVELGQESVRTDDFNGEGIKRIRELFEPDAPIVLLSCSTGSNDFSNPIGKALAEIFGRDVTAPTVDTGVSELGAHYTTKGKIRLDVAYSQGTKRKFKGTRTFDSA